MTSRPLTLRDPSLSAFMAGTMTTVLRPLRGMYTRCQPGERLWIREPFRLPRYLNAMAPTVVRDRTEARPTFETDLVRGQVECEDLGPCRFARNLPRAWHRQHAVIVAVEPFPLARLTDADARAEGYRSREAWGEAWDKGIALSFSAPLFATGGDVLRIQLRRVPHPLPEDATPEMRPLEEMPA